MFCFWISLCLKMGPIGCSETSERNCHSMGHCIPAEHRSHMIIWQCRPWFGSTQSGSEWSGLAWSGSVLHTQISHDLTYVSTKFTEKTLSCIWLHKVITLWILDTAGRRNKTVWNATVYVPKRSIWHKIFGTTKRMSGNYIVGSQNRVTIKHTFPFILSMLIIALTWNEQRLNLIIVVINSF